LIARFEYQPGLALRIINKCQTFFLRNFYSEMMHSIKRDLIEKFKDFKKDFYLNSY